MMYRTLPCPHCGNDTTVRSENDPQKPQKCRWCRRLLSVKVKRIKGKKFQWDVEPVEFQPKIKTLTEYEMEDVYGVRYQCRNPKKPHRG